MFKYVYKVLKNEFFIKYQIEVFLSYFLVVRNRYFVLIYFCYFIDFYIVKCCFWVFLLMIFKGSWSLLGYLYIFFELEIEK